MLPRGITGFYDGHQPPPPMLDENCFDRFCYALARAMAAPSVPWTMTSQEKTFTPLGWSCAILPACSWSMLTTPMGPLPHPLAPWPPFFWDPPVDPAPFWPEVQWMTQRSFSKTGMERWGTGRGGDRADPLLESPNRGRDPVHFWD